ncbi:hypothetical protein Plhal703r1_c50g0154101 [Plasmopara halstedii]
MKKPQIRCPRGNKKISAVGVTKRAYRGKNWMRLLIGVGEVE